MKRRIISAAAIAAALILAGCSAQGTTPAGSDDGGTTGDLTKISIGGVVTTSTVPIFLGQHEGIFAKHGLDVSMEPTQNFAAAAPSLLNGQLQFAIAAVPPFILAVDKKMPLVAVAGSSATVEDPTKEGNQVVVRADSGITTIQQLKGKKIATNQVGSGPYVGFLATYLRAGGSAEDIEWISMPMNEQLAALEKGTIDAAVLAEPYTAMAVSDGDVALSSAYRAPGHEILEAGDPYVVVLTSSKYAQAEPKVVAAFREALIEADDFAAAHPDKVIAALESQADMDPKLADKIRLPGFVGALTGDELQRMADAMYDVGILTSKFDGKAAVWQP